MAGNTDSATLTWQRRRDGLTREVRRASSMPVIGICVSPGFATVCLALAINGA